ncbi:MAG: hypothetical protein AAGF47_04390 [Planctomycetota bacterium]
MWAFWSKAKRLDYAERARRAHEAWLDHAVRTGRGHPKIPKREVRLGGFSEQIRTPEGRAWAREWWNEALTGRSE